VRGPYCCAVNDKDLLPLRDRVAADAALALPEGPRGYTWRALRRDDAPLLTTLSERISSRDHPSWSESLEEVEEELSRSWTDPSTDGVLCLDSGGAAVAGGLAIMPPDPATIVRVILSGGVDPAHRGRGLGRRLLAWQHGRARQRLAASDHVLPAWVMSYAADRAPEHGSLLRHAGFEAARFFTTLECDLVRETKRTPAPQGTRIEPFTAERSEAVRSAKNSAFVDHWGSQPTGVEQWSSLVALSTFRPELSRIALDGDEVVGFVTTEVNEDDWVRQGYSSGYISLVGTVRAWRRRGLASALLAEVLESYRRAGIERAVLDVDTESPTGALGVYTALGFSPTARDVAYRLAY